MCICYFCNSLLKTHPFCPRYMFPHTLTSDQVVYVYSGSWVLGSTQFFCFCELQETNYVYGLFRIHFFSKLLLVLLWHFHHYKKAAGLRWRCRVRCLSFSLLMACTEHGKGASQHQCFSSYTARFVSAMEVQHDRDPDPCSHGCALPKWAIPLSPFQLSSCCD